MSGSDSACSVSQSDASMPPDNGLMIEGPPWGIEKIYDYEKGGHHPVHLGDVLHERYKVIHKLGSGGYANVWLCRGISIDTPPKYFAIKIIMAEESTKECTEFRITKLLKASDGDEMAREYICLPLDTFELTGPNGTHYAFVYPVLGPRVSRLVPIAMADDPGPALRNMAWNATQAMAILHAQGICHGDFRPANILPLIEGLDGLSEEEVLGVLGVPKTTKVVIASDKPDEPGDDHELETAPKYLVYPVDWDEALTNAAGESTLTIGSAYVTDFGESFEVSRPPAGLGIPQAYCSPEQVLEQKVGIGSDLWALGCTLFETRTGQKLFGTFDDDVEEHLWKVALILGKYPEPWWSETWEMRAQFFEDDVDATGRVVEVRQEMEAQKEDEQHDVVCWRPEPRSLREAIGWGLEYQDTRGPERLHRDIPSAEAEILADLLVQLLRYDPKDRIPASCVLEHKWFKMGA